MSLSLVSVRGFRIDRCSVRTWKGCLNAWMRYKAPTRSLRSLLQSGLVSVTAALSQLWASVTCISQGLARYLKKEVFEHWELEACTSLASSGSQSQEETAQGIWKCQKQREARQPPGKWLLTRHWICRSPKLGCCCRGVASLGFPNPEKEAFL